MPMNSIPDQKKPYLLFLAALVMGALVSSLALAGEGDQGTGQRSPGQTTRPNEASQQNRVEEGLKQADLLGRQGRLEDAVGVLRQLRLQHPRDQRLGASLARLMNARGRELLEQGNSTSSRDWIEGAAVLAHEIVDGAGESQVAVLKSFLATTIYDQACIAAIAGSNDEALLRLAEAFAWGFDEFERTMSDRHLASITSTREFQSLMDEQRTIAVERLHEKTLNELDEFEPYEFDFRLAGLEKGVVSLGDYKGKIVIVDFWGTWCGPCRNEIPLFVRLKKELGEQGLDVIGLNYQEPGINEVKRVIEELDINYACAMGTDEVKAQVPNFEGFPTTLFIDGEGNVRLQLVGLHSYERLEAICQCLIDENHGDSTSVQARSASE